MTRALGLVGQNISHSLSPRIFELLGYPDYRLFDLTRAEVARFFGERDFHAVNVTSPYKAEVAGLCDLLSDTARRIGAVNTVLCLPDRRLFGHNTDSEGFEFLVRRSGFDPTEKKALIFGAAGAANAAADALRRMGAKEPVFVTRHSGDPALNTDAAVIVNASPSGSAPDDPPLCDFSAFYSCEAYFDMLYSPLRTPSLYAAGGLGLRHANGLAMLAAQACGSAMTFFGTSGDPEAITRTLERETLSIVLTGMPGCGKSTLANTLGAALGRPVYDTDDMITEAAGATPEELILTRGEEYFRRLETDAVARVARLRGAVIAVGGGAPVSEQNRALLRRNAAVFYIDRPLSLLDRSHRPLSADANALEKLYAQRDPLYRDCDGILDGSLPADVLCSALITALDRAEWGKIL